MGTRHMAQTKQVREKNATNLEFYTWKIILLKWRKKQTWVSKTNIPSVVSRPAEKKRQRSQVGKKITITQVMYIWHTIEEDKRGKQSFAYSKLSKAERDKNKDTDNK